VEVTEVEETEVLDGVIEFPDKLELFYTVQVGYYLVADSVDYSQKFGFEAIRITLPNGGERYFYGFFDDVEQAKDIREALVNSTMQDAFVVPYYQGKRITNAQAEKLLMKYGRKILLSKTASK
jgi:hypothetical protein